MQQTRRAAAKDWVVALLPSPKGLGVLVGEGTGQSAKEKSLLMEMGGEGITKLSATTPITQVA